MNSSDRVTLEYELRKAIDALNNASVYAPNDRAIRGRIAKAEKLAREALSKAERLIPEGDHEYNYN